MTLAEIIKFVGGWILICTAWALFVFATSLAWSLGRIYIDYRTFKLALAKWQKKDRIEDIDWGIENPNEERNGRKTTNRKR